MSAEPTRSDRHGGRRRTATPDRALTADRAPRATSRPRADRSVDALTTKYSGRRWARATDDASVIDDPTTVRAVVANDTLAPGRVFAPPQRPGRDDEPRARSSAHVVIAVGLCLFPLGIVSHAFWVGRSDASATTTTTTAPVALARELASTPRAPAAAALRPTSAVGASARVQAPPRIAQASSPARVLNPIAEAVLRSSQPQVARDHLDASQDAVIAELLAELEAPAAVLHAASTRPAHPRARLRHRLARAARARHSLRGIPPNPFD